MIKDEYKKLLAMLDKSSDLENFSLEDTLKEAVTFFETLRKEFPQATKEERDEMVHMMTTLHAKLQEVSKRTAELSGMSEDELAAYSENPSNFTPEQWQMVQSTKRELYDSARKFSSAMDEKKRESGEPVKKAKTIKSKARRTPRKQWKKS